MAGQGQLNWGNVVFLLFSPLVAVVAVGLYAYNQGFHAGDLVCFSSMMLLTGLSITAGYHRHYSHRTYDCHRGLQTFYLLFGAAALQTSVLNWVSDHRNHHRFVDRDGDPYNSRKGFFWAHMGWIFYEDVTPRSLDNVSDLKRDPLVLAQHRFHFPLGLAVGFGLAYLIGLAFGRPWGGVLWGGLLRVVVAQHGTFLVNSAAHYFGRQPYSEANSSRDNGWLALLTLGEGHHNFHHAFPGDYRNGARWYDWDPTKWWIRGLSAVGLAWGLNRTPAELVTGTRARMKARNTAPVFEPERQEDARDDGETARAHD